MDKVTEIVHAAETRCNEINDEIKQMEIRLQALKDERHIILAVLEAAKKASHEVYQPPKAR